MCEVKKNSVNDTKLLSGHESKNKETGFTYIGLLVLLNILSLGLLMSYESSAVGSKREKENQLLFAGDQIRKAIESYTQRADVPTCYPASLKSLVYDTRGKKSVSHLRQLYPDPITGSQKWGIVYDDTGRLIGVHSQSGDYPYKKDGYVGAYIDFNGKSTYSEWLFVAEMNKNAFSIEKCHID